MTESSELDALFGAFDGNDVDTNSPPGENEKSYDEVLVVESASPNERPKAQSIYTSVMSKPLTSQLRDDKRQHQQDRKSTTVKNSMTLLNEGEEEIATGTSHDKSVRSYSAYPKNLPPELQSLKKKKLSHPKILPKSIHLSWTLSKRRPSDTLIRKSRFS